MHFKFIIIYIRSSSLSLTTLELPAIMLSFLLIINQIYYQKIKMDQKCNVQLDSINIRQQQNTKSKPKQKQNSHNQHYIHIQNQKQYQFQQQYKKNEDKTQERQSFQSQMHRASPQKLKTNTKPEYLQQYTNFMQLSLNGENIRKFQSFQNVQNLYLKLKQENIQQCNDSLQRFTVLEILQSKTLQIVQLTVQMSNLKMKITIFNTELQQIIEDQIQIHKYGAFGQIYLCQFCNQKYAIKKIKIKSQLQIAEKNCEYLAEHIIESAKQYFFARIFSALQIGPKVKDIFGFDMIVNCTAAYFSMEICSEVKSFPKQDLTKLIKTMHSLKIVHKDIKTSNLMQSHQYKKYVLIDFGGCTFIEEQVGYKSLTKFYGTLRYCSQEMKQLEQQCYLIDLYYNDLFALMKVLCLNQGQLRISQSQVLQSIQSVNIKQDILFVDEQMVQQFLKYEFLLIKCKSFIWRRNIDQLVQFSKVQHLKLFKNFQQNILDFLLQIIPYKELVSFYDNQISSQIKQIQKFANLKVIYTSQFSFTYELMQQQSQNYIQIIFGPIYLKISQQNESPFQYRKKILNFSTLKQDFSNFKYQQVLLNLQAMKKMNKQQRIMLTLDYITFTENYFQSNLQNKQKVCEVFLQSVGFQYKIKQKNYNQKELLIKTFFYMLQKGIKIIKIKRIAKFYLKVFQNLFLLGVRITDFQSIKIIKQCKQVMPIKDNFLFLWTFLALFQGYHQKVLYDDYKQHTTQNQQKLDQQKLDKNKKHAYYFTMLSNFNISQKLINQIIIIFAIEFKKLEKQNKLQFFMNEALRFIEIKHGSYSQKDLIRICDRLKNKKLFNNLTERQYLNLSLCIITHLKWLLCQPQIQKIQQQNYFFFFEFASRQSFQYKQIPIYFSNIATQASYQSKFQKANKLYQYFDRIVNAEQISNCFSIQQRVSIVYYLKNLTKLKKLVHIIFSLQKKQFVEHVLYFNLLLNTLKQNFNAEQVHSSSSSSSYAFAKIMIESLEHKNNKTLVQLEQLILKYYFQNLQIRQVDNTPLQFYFFTLKFFLQNRRSSTSKKLLYSQDFYMKRVQFFEIVSQKMLRSLQRYSFFFCSYIFIIHIIYCENNKHKQFQTTVNKLYQIRPEMNNFLQNFKHKQTIHLYQISFVFCILYNSIILKGQSVEIYRQFLILYESLISHNQFSYCLNLYNLLFRIWKGLVVCQQDSQEKLLFLARNVNHLDQNLTKLSLKNFHNNIKDIFIESHQTLIQQQFSPVIFIDYLLNQTQNDNEKSAYWCLIYYYCLKNKSINYETKLNLIKQVAKSVPYVKLEARQIVFQKFYQIVNQCIAKSQNKVINMRGCVLKTRKDINSRNAKDIKKQLSKILSKNSKVYHIMCKKIQIFKGVSFSQD